MTVIKTPIVEIKELNLPLYSLQPKQLECYQLTPLYRPPGTAGPVHIGYGGAAGGGKSYLSRGVFTAAAMMWPGSTSIIFRRTEGEVLANHVNKFRSEVPDVIGGKRLYKYKGDDLVVEWFNKSRTYFGYLKSDEDVFTYQGPEYDVMIFEEATQYSHFQINWLTGNRLRSTIRGTKPFALYPSNPGGKGHFWYKRLFIERRYHEADGEKAEDFAFLQAKLRDNMELMERDPSYEAKLNKLPEPWRSWQRDGDFAAGAGTALNELTREHHLIRPFMLPPHWPVFGSFDWGFAHPFSFGLYAVNEDGVTFKIDTITGRRLLPHEIAQRVRGRMEQLGIPKLSYTVAGHDAWANRKAMGENTPTIADTFAELGLPLLQANIDRKMGLQELRKATAWKTTGANDGPGEPRFRLFETETNKRCFEQLENRVTDPDDPEDVLKTDADEWGEGGDDFYDETRYAIASRPMAAKSTWGDAGQVNAWSPDTLAAERDRLTKGRGDRQVQRPNDHYEEIQ